MRIAWRAESVMRWAISSRGDAMVQLDRRLQWARMSIVWREETARLPRNRQTNLWWTASAIKVVDDPPRAPAIEDAPETVTSIRKKIPITPDFCVVDIDSSGVGIGTC